MNARDELQPDWIRPFGATGLSVSALGFGAMHFDGLEDETAVGRLLNGVLDAGLTLIDTARGYGRSEARIGQHLAHRRRDFVLSTKFGYGVEGVPDWTYDCIVQGVERALRLMRTEVIDVGHLHSCPLDVLQRGEVSQALADCVRAGKLRVAAYSGENAELAHALADDRFAAVQCSLSLVDRANAPQVAATPKGVLVKRALAGRAWARPQRPEDFCEGQYWDRWQALGLSAGQAADLDADLKADWPALALRFAAFAPGVSSVLVGSQRLDNLRALQAAWAQGPLPAAWLQDSEARWRSAGGPHWPGLV
ncbi:aldo/keto reductase [Inhella gelatinilytica]|uniref:Aldo/keto reductase n=1 Tax=Inhella gelatinilytica TaxID=2795030 RepID=A0A931IVJ1_9BURK|nr:aldo/keto reductase [Inhella gelatinilytica]MBH9551775.1 aldo/keto reductase [Inhella gelatinilytica]